MSKYLYTFGYTSPGRPQSSDFEDNHEFFIIADSKEKALEWGKHLSDTYIDSLRQETKDSRITKGAEWVKPEEQLREGEPPTDYSDTPVIRYGEVVNLLTIFKEQEEREDFGEFKGFGEKRR